MRRENQYPIGAAITVDQLTGDPHPHLARLRAHEPVSWIPALDCWLVTRRDLAIQVMRDATIFTVDDPRFSTARVIGPSMLSLDGPDHLRHRQPFAAPFRAEGVHRTLGPFVTSRARQLVESVAADGRADLRASLAAPLAIDTMAEVLDLEGVDPGELLAWYEAIVDSVHAITGGDHVPPTGTAAFRSLHQAVEHSLGHSRMLTSVADEGRLTVDEIVSNVAVLLFGGIVTSESTTALALQFLLEDARTREDVIADRSLVANAVEEALRLEPSAAVVDRYATAAVRLGDAEIAPGELVRVSLAGANRDPTVFAAPDRFDVRRPRATQHVAFARGPHTCLGIHLARLESVAAVHAVLDLLPGVQLDPGCYEPPSGLVFRAPKTVEAVWKVAR